MLDNTWATPLNFRAFDHGVDVEVQAGTKYLAGHSDLLIGTITVRTEEHFRAVKDDVIAFGDCVSPDVCYETLRGLRTLGVRMRQLEASTLEIARWLADRPEVARVLHPAMPDHPGHDVWKRDFQGSSSLFGVLLRTDSMDAVGRMVDGFRLFKIGSSFGGFESLVASRPGDARASLEGAGHLLRFHVGLEAVEDLIADLEKGSLDRVRRHHERRNHPGRREETGAGRRPHATRGPARDGAQLLKERSRRCAAWTRARGTLASPRPVRRRAGGDHGAR